MSEITKKALVSSLIALCDEKKLNKITVQDIVNKCGVNRNTFYYHFADIYDLLDYMFRNEYEYVIGSIKSYSDLREGITLVETHDLDNLSQDDLFIVEAYFKCGIVGLVLNWIERGMPGDMIHLSNQLIRLAESTIKGIKENMEVKKC